MAGGTPDHRVRPTYSDTVLDDHNGCVTTDCVEATKRLIDSMKTKYTVDASRIYGTGQSMGGASYHMASFDYAYRRIAAMEWLFQ